MRTRQVAELALLISFVEAMFAGASSVPLAALLQPFTDSELLATGTPHAIEALRLALPQLPEVAPVALAWFGAGLLSVMLARCYVYRRTALLSHWSLEGPPRVISFLFLSLASLVAKIVLVAGMGLLAANLAAAGPGAWPLRVVAALLLLALHACIAAWVDASRALVTVGVSPLRALARGTEIATNARLAGLRAGLAMLHLVTAPLGYLAVAITEGGAVGGLLAGCVQGLLFCLCFAEVRWVGALGRPLGLAGGARTPPSQATSVQTAPSPSGA